MRQIKFFIFILVSFISGVFALPADNTQNMHIQADATVFNYKSGFNIYQGNVKIVQGSTRLNADKVTTQNNANHKLEEAIAYGKNARAHYWTIPREGNSTLNALAKVIKFYPNKSMVILEGDVFVTQGKNSFHGELMYYNIKDQTVTSPQNKKGHSTIIIEPDQVSL